MKNPICYRVTALSDLWTGDIDGKRERLITTGLLGSIRWWFEVLVRGLGGSACNPTDTMCEGRNHCVVCELFGCTGWARKFRFEVLDENGNIKTDQIKQDRTFSLRFIPLRPIREEEWTLLDATLRLIAEYGALGGKTVFKPTDEANRASILYHKDYGLVQIQQFNGASREDLGAYLSLSKWRKVDHGEFTWTSLQHFWCVNGKYLGRENHNKSSFNKVLGRKEPKNQGQQFHNSATDVDRWLAGSQQESKKVFSFKAPARTFGFVKPRLIGFDAMKKRLQDVWGKDGWEFLTGENIIDQIFAKEEDCS
ncbi:MAG: type III-B CRISPR module RAMP protein Cmr1 [Deltaproteobacteria bacterium]|nr:type III-B CRISPR module RAMP protein Cmr1 [Deltaproteobacteria bacterium]